MPLASTLSIAAYGFVDRDSGSVASANFLIIEELLRLGHRVDFYAIDGFIKPVELIGRPGFSYVPITLPPIRRIWNFIEERLPTKLGRLVSLAFSQVSNHCHEREIGKRVNLRHEDLPYDMFIMLGGLSPFATPGVFNIGWPQGAPNGEWDAIQSQKRRVIKLTGRFSYLFLKSGYLYKKWQNRAQLSNGDLILCGSEWSKAKWIEFGADSRSVFPMPYPYDLERFRPAAPLGQAETITFLCLGRIVPRKRIDLLIEAFRLLRATHPEARLLIIGRFAYAEGFESLLGDSDSGSGIEYRPFIDRAQVPELLAEVDVVIQTSEMENLGSAVIEGLACGRPVILGPTNGTRDYISDSSIVFRDYTPEAVCEAMALMCVRVRTEAEKLEREAREAALLHVRLDRVVERVLELATSEQTRTRG